MRIAIALIFVVIWFLAKGQDIPKNKIAPAFNNLPEADLNIFYKTLAGNIKYPPKAREKQIAGLVTAAFKINKHRQIDDIRIVKSADTVFNSQVITGLLKCAISPLMKTGYTYAVPVYFMSDDDNDPNWWRRTYHRQPAYNETLSIALNTPVVLLSDVVIIYYKPRS